MRSKLPRRLKFFHHPVDYSDELIHQEEAPAMKITSLAYEAQDLLTPVEQTPQKKSSPEYAERAALADLQDQRQGAATGEQEEISLQKLQNLTDAVDSYMSSLGVNLKFHIDEKTDTVQVEVRDPETQKLIRKIPADEMLELAASIEKWSACSWTEPSSKKLRHDKKPAPEFPERVFCRGCAYD
jgi:flagellar protein FlaG